MSPRALPLKMNPRNSSKFKLVSGLAGAALFAPLTASAALVAYEGFEYNISGGAGLAGKGVAGDGWEAAWTGSGTIVADNMSYVAGSLSVQGGTQAVRINGTNQAYFYRQFETISGVSEVYFSFLFKSVTGGTDDYLNFWLSDDNDRANSAGIGDVAGSSRFGVRIFGDDTSTNTSSQSNIAYTEGGGAVYLLVGRISTEGTTGATGDVFDKIELWVNPTSTNLGEAHWFSDRSTMLTTSVGFSFFGLQSSSIAASDDIRIDELRIGTSAAGVLSAIPEPSASAAVLGGVALLCGMRRRHTARAK